MLFRSIGVRRRCCEERQRIHWSPGSCRGTGWKRYILSKATGRVCHRSLLNAEQRVSLLTESQEHASHHLSSHHVPCTISATCSSPLRSLLTVTPDPLSLPPSTLNPTSPLCVVPFDSIVRPAHASWRQMSGTEIATFANGWCVSCLCKLERERS